MSEEGEVFSPREAKRLWAELQEHRAWQWLMVIAEGQLENRRETIMAPMRPGDEYEREFLKGEIAGIRTFMSLPATAVQVAESEIAQEESES